MATKAELRAFADKISNSPEQKKYAKAMGDAIYNASREKSTAKNKKK